MSHYDDFTEHEPEPADDEIRARVIAEERARWLNDDGLLPWER